MAQYICKADYQEKEGAHKITKGTLVEANIPPFGSITVYDDGPCVYVSNYSFSSFFERPTKQQFQDISDANEKAENVDNFHPYNER